jgi:hypothetical protein
MEEMKRITKTAKNRAISRDDIKTITQENPSSVREDAAYYSSSQVISLTDRSQRNSRRG